MLWTAGKDEESDDDWEGALLRSDEKKRRELLKKEKGAGNSLEEVDEGPPPHELRSSTPQVLEASNDAACACLFASFHDLSAIGYSPCIHLRLKLIARDPPSSRDWSMRQRACHFIQEVHQSDLIAESFEERQTTLTTSCIRRAQQHNIFPSTPISL